MANEVMRPSLEELQEMGKTRVKPFKDGKVVQDADPQPAQQQAQQQPAAQAAAQPQEEPSERRVLEDEVSHGEAQPQEQPAVEKAPMNIAIGTGNVEDVESSGQEPPVPVQQEPQPDTQAQEQPSEPARQAPEQPPALQQQQAAVQLAPAQQQAPAQPQPETNPQADIANVLVTVPDDGGTAKKVDVNAALLETAKRRIIENGWAPSGEVMNVSVVAAAVAVCFGLELPDTDKFKAARNLAELLRDQQRSVTGAVPFDGKTEGEKRLMDFIHRRLTYQDALLYGIYLKGFFGTDDFVDVLKSDATNPNRVISDSPGFEELRSLVQRTADRIERQRRDETFRNRQKHG